MRLAMETNLPEKRIDRATVPGAPWQSVRLVNEAVRSTFGWVELLHQELRRTVVGKERLVDRLLIGLLTGGHLLLDGGPGLAKSRTLRALSAAIGADFRRVTLSTDMVPEDLFAALVTDPDTSAPTMGPGSIYPNLLLAEDLHRTPPMVQNALLQAMEDREINIRGEKHSLPDPFLVVATTRPATDEQPHPLTESQADHFLMQVVLDFPDSDEEREILDVAGNGRRSPMVRSVLSLEELLHARRVVHSIYVNSMIKDYAVALVSATRVAATRDHGNGNAAYQGPDRDTSFPPITANGASPRATVDLIRAARAHAFLSGRGFVTPKDVKSVTPDVLRHRLSQSTRAGENGGSTETIIRRILDTVAVP